MPNPTEQIDREHRDECELRAQQSIAVLSHIEETLRTKLDRDTDLPPLIRAIRALSKALSAFLLSDPLLTSNALDGAAMRPNLPRLLQHAPSEAHGSAMVRMIESASSLLLGGQGDQRACRCLDVTAGAPTLREAWLSLLDVTARCAVALRSAGAAHSEPLSSPLLLMRVQVGRLNQMLCYPDQDVKDKINHPPLTGNLALGLDRYFSQL